MHEVACCTVRRSDREKMRHSFSCPERWDESEEKSRTLVTNHRSPFDLSVYFPRAGFFLAGCTASIALELRSRLVWSRTRFFKQPKPRLNCSSSDGNFYREWRDYGNTGRENRIYLYFIVMSLVLYVLFKRLKNFIDNAKVMLDNIGLEKAGVYVLWVIYGFFKLFGNFITNDRIMLILDFGRIESFIEIYLGLYWHSVWKELNCLYFRGTVWVFKISRRR